MQHDRTRSAATTEGFFLIYFVYFEKRTMQTQFKSQIWHSLLVQISVQYILSTNQNIDFAAFVLMKYLNRIIKDEQNFKLIGTIYFCIYIQNSNSFNLTLEINNLKYMNYIGFVQTNLMWISSCTWKHIVSYIKSL